MCSGGLPVSAPERHSVQRSQGEIAAWPEMFMHCKHNNYENENEQVEKFLVQIMLCVCVCVCVCVCTCRCITTIILVLFIDFVA